MLAKIGEEGLAFPATDGGLLTMPASGKLFFSPGRNSMELVVTIRKTME